MATAIIIAVMMSFLMLIGMTLIADGAGFHVPKGYIYAAIGFSVGVEALNQLAARRRRLRRGIRSAPPIKHGGGAANTANGEVVC
jgi:predicted tellurium resistance membrane protein TerC